MGTGNGYRNCYRKFSNYSPLRISGLELDGRPRAEGRCFVAGRRRTLRPGACRRRAGPDMRPRPLKGDLVTLPSIASEPLTLLYLAHLRWDHVWQRPQQLMTRFARRCRVIYGAPPEVRPPARPLQLGERRGGGGVQVLRPFFPAGLLDTPGQSYETLWLQMLPATLAQAGTN